MVKESLINQIQNDFKFIEGNPEIMGLLLFGSYLTEDQTPRSDIDICIVVKNQDLSKMYNYITENLENNIGIYDIRFFEELPLYIQGQIIEEGLPIICRDKPEMYEYFYKFRKIWEDVKFRLNYII